MKIRSIALINLLALTASSFSPLYADTREDDLNRKEAILQERALTLSDKEINLEDKEQELNRKGAELDEVSKNIQAQRVENSVREIELEDMRAKLNRESELLAARTSELDKDREEVALMREENDRRKSEADKLFREADDRLRQAEAKELQAKEREHELSALEAQLKEGRKTVSIARARVLMSPQSEEEIYKKLADLDTREKALKQAQDVLAEEKQKLEDGKIFVKAMRDEAAKVMADANAKMAAAEEKSREAERIIAKNDDQKARIDQLVRELDAKDQEIAALLSKMPRWASQKGGSIIPKNASISITDKGLMNWSDGSIRARGFGIPRDGTSGQQAKALARRAAIVDLQRNLLETIEGVQVDAHTTVKDYMATDEVKTAVNGIIRGVEIVEENWDGEAYVVLGQVRQGGMLDSGLSKSVKMGKVPPAPKKDGDSFTGLIIDARHLNIIQQKYFHVVDESGQIVYGTEVTDKRIQSQIGLCAYFDKIVYEYNESRVGSNPFVIKAQRLSSNSDIVISNDAARKILRNRVDFRKECKVIVVKS